ncbi:cytochrome P450 [Artemisia annua]|uniref:Cytochrome P450 n=1 Tax=Artemisia annua TaxID=35608 RepID=A0A2U1KCU9_ARTAN|nr:cytochrome P450 [Artemisia annua]
MGCCVQQWVNKSYCIIWVFTAYVPTMGEDFLRFRASELSHGYGQQIQTTAGIVKSKSTKVQLSRCMKGNSHHADGGKALDANVHVMENISDKTIPTKVMLGVDRIDMINGIPLLRDRSTRFNHGVKASNKIREVINGIMVQRRKDVTDGTATPTQELLSHMIAEVDKRNQESGGTPTTDGDMSSDLLGFLIGGYDTINTTVVFIMMMLVDHPNVYKKVLKANGDSRGETTG